MDLSRNPQTTQSGSSKANGQWCLYKHGPELPEDLSGKKYCNFTRKDDCENRNISYSPTSSNAAVSEMELPLNLSRKPTMMSIYIPPSQDNKCQQTRYRQVNCQSFDDERPMDLSSTARWNSSQCRFASTTSCSRSTHRADQILSDTPSSLVTAQDEYGVDHSFTYPQARALSTDSSSWLSADSVWNKPELMQSSNEETVYRQQQCVTASPPEYNFPSLPTSVIRPLTEKSKVELAPACKSYACDICGKSYKQVRDYRAHLATHKDSNIYKCDICLCELNLASNYVQHLKTHQLAELNICTYCHRYFRDKCTLHTHLRTHTGEKPYECELCGKRFAQNGTCTRHKKVHR